MKMSERTDVAVVLGFIMSMSLFAAQAEAAIEVITTQQGGVVCATVTFEGAVHGAPVGHVPEAGLIFEMGEGPEDGPVPGWYTLTRGPFTNTPTPPTVAMLCLIYSGAVSFTTPASAVSLYYASRVPVTLEAFDASGALLASASGPANAGALFNVWDPIGVDLGENLIARVVLTGAAFNTAIDDFTVCRIVTPEEMLVEMALFIMDEVGAGNVAPELEVSLRAKVEAALSALEEGNPNAAKVAMNDLKALINQVEAQTDNKITPEAAMEIIESANEIITALGG
jgi:hypothetical protein